jgi:hypothetical protein
MGSTGRKVFGLYVEFGPGYRDQGLTHLNAIQRWNQRL